MNQNQPHEHYLASLVFQAGSCIVVVWMFVTLARISSDNLPRSTGLLAGVLGPIVMVGGLLLLRTHFHLGYSVLALGSALPLPWFFQTESRAFANSWIALNSPFNDPYSLRYMRYSQLRIISVALLLTTLILAAIRLLPSHWQFLNHPMNNLTWPAIAISSLFVLCWFAAYVFPYRQPVIIDALQPELGILHVEKNGIVFQETSIRIYRDGRYWIARNDRHLFRYSFVERAQEGLLRADLRSKLSAIVALPALKRTLDTAPTALRGRRGEGWYTEMGNYEIAAFTTENSTPPPADLQAFFNEIVANTPLGPSALRYEVRDVCLGFCYDPKAGLGHRAENERCAERYGEELCY